MRYSAKKSSKYYKKHRSIKSKLFLAIALILIITGIYLSVEYFKIEEVRIVGVKHSEKAEIHKNIDDSLIEKNIFLISNQEIDRIIAEKAPKYVVKSVTRTPPNFISIELKIRKPKYYVQSGGVKYAVDEEFVPTLASNGDTSQFVQYDKSITIGEKIEDEILIAALHYSNMSKVVYVNGVEIYIELEGGGKVILPDEDAIEKSAELSNLLQKIVQKYTIENRSISVIDLRYSKPLIKFN